MTAFFCLVVALVLGLFLFYLSLQSPVDLSRAHIGWLFRIQAWLGIVGVVLAGGSIVMAYALAAIKLMGGK